MLRIDNGSVEVTIKEIAASSLTKPKLTRDEDNESPGRTTFHILVLDFPFLKIIAAFFNCGIPKIVRYFLDYQLDMLYRVTKRSAVNGMVVMKKKIQNINDVVFVIPSEDSTTINYIRKSYLAFIDDFEFIILEEAGFRNAPQVKAN